MYPMEFKYFFLRDFKHIFFIEEGPYITFNLEFSFVISMNMVKNGKI